MPEFQTKDKAFGRLLETARRAARTQAGIFITGESGAGKNRLAGYIHDHSLRSTGPLIQVACANLPVGLLDDVAGGMPLSGQRFEPHRVAQAAGP